ncbi:rhodanese-related sulfurtransferase [bacterium]|nr:MAG: rhodanese-related sulfurtransferase [bacterium]QQR61577.1 MAG: rhodanese-related sulfurtransferase [bacterium]QQR62887.1 MAG: rhodanese-related sulfurtransferase [bacterium]
MSKIILFYKYVDIQYPKRIAKWQQKICSDLQLKGRVIIAHEGINSTLGGTDQQIERYKRLMEQHELFGSIDFKESAGGADCFPRLSIKVKNEIVRMGVDPAVLTIKQGGQHLMPEKVHELLNKNPEDLVILDTRNRCESDIGAFQGALKADIRYFREFPDYIDKNIDLFKDKQVLMYCTGGVRCERATAYLNVKNVAKKIYQLEGGIHRYIEKYPDGFFRGKNYVFDGRLSVASNEDILSRCALCQKTCDEYNNCLNASCNKHFVCCQGCKQQFHGTCGPACQTLVSQAAVPIRPEFKVVKV